MREYIRERKFRIRMGYSCLMLQIKTSREEF